MKLLRYLVLFVALFAPWPAGAQEGNFVRASCSTILLPVVNKTWCFQQSDGVIYVWRGTWETLSGSGGGGGGGSVSSVGLTGTANQIIVTGASPISTTGSWALSFAAGGVTLPGTTTGTFSGNLTGNTTGTHTGSVTGNITGNVTGNLTGSVTGNVTGNLTGDVTGNVTGTASGNQPIDADLTALAAVTGADLISGKLHYAADAGSTDAYAACPAALVPAGALVDGSFAFIKFNTVNTDGATFDACSYGGTHAIVKNVGGLAQPLITNDIRAGSTGLLKYTSSTGNWELLSITGNTASGVGDVTAASNFATDNSCLRADGTSKGAQATSTNCTISDPGDMSLASSITVPVATIGNIGTVAVGWAPGALALTGNSVVASFNYAASQDVAARAASPTTGHCGRFSSTAVLVNGGSCRRSVEIEVFPAGTSVTSGDGKAYYLVPSILNGMNLVAVTASVITAGTTGTTDIQVARCAVVASGNACGGTVADMLSTKTTIDSGESNTSSAAAAAVINASNDDVATNQMIRIDIDAVSTTPPQGLLVNLEFELP